MSKSPSLKNLADTVSQQGKELAELKVAAKEKAEYSENGNSATAESYHRNPQTVDELLNICNVDLSIWTIDHYVVNKWDQGAKLPSGEIVVTPLFQIKAWLIRKIAITTELPEIKPIVFSIKERKLEEPKKRKLETAIVWPDIQTGFRRDLKTGKLDPFHDRRALEIAYMLTKHIKPDRVVFLGDNLDLADWSDKFIHSPEFSMNTQHAGIELGWWYARVRAINPNMKIDVIEGNHDFRMEKSIWKYQPYSYGIAPINEPDGLPLMSMERFLGLKSLNIQYHGPYPSGRVWLNDNLSLQHGEIAKAKSGATVRTMLDDLRHSEGQGHIHRMESACKTVWTREGPKVYMAFSPGTLARIDPGIVPAHKYRQNWQQGTALCEYQTGNGYFNVYQIQIHSGEAVYDQREWRARSDREIAKHISDDTGIAF